MTIAETVDKLKGDRKAPGIEYETVGKYNYSKDELSVSTSCLLVSSMKTFS